MGSDVGETSERAAVKTLYTAAFHGSDLRALDYVTRPGTGRSQCAAQRRVNGISLLIEAKR
jgi:hypothetical protein